MIDLGHFALAAAWFLSLYSSGLGIYGAFCSRQRFVESASNALVLTAAFSFLSLVALAAAFLHHDYRYLYVWRTSNNEMPWPYLISAIWGGMDGSLLLWATLGAVYAALSKSLIAAQLKLTNWVTPLLSVSNLFFLSVVIFLTNPFRLIQSEAGPLNGNGLNPLLQNPSMMIHPPSLYLGFTGFVVPFAFALGALISGEFEWLSAVRRWILVPWTFLTAGIVLGGNWAYIELGWGGFWAWDPVENASFLPWLAGTALIHSSMVEERRAMLRVWNIALAILTYLLAVFGTFLTRSGIVQSVHAFAESDVGWIFLAYLGVVAVISLALIFFRCAQLRSNNIIESFLSREAIFLYNNLILLCICFVTLWGVLFPVLSEGLIGEKSSIGPPFYNSVNGPLFLILLFFMALGPLISWRSMELKKLCVSSLAPFFCSLAVVAAFLIFNPWQSKAAISFFLASFISFSILRELYRWSRTMRAASPELKGGFKFSQRRRIAGLLVHLGVGIMAVAITASTLFKIERDFVVRPGEKFNLGRYTLKLADIRESANDNFQSIKTDVEIYYRDQSVLLGSLRPERRFYPRSEEVTSEVDIRMTAREDLYLALAGLGKSGEVVFKGFINPLQLWLWIGSILVVLSSFLAILSVPK